MAQKYQTLLKGLSKVDREMARRVTPAGWNEIHQQDLYSHVWERGDVQVCYKKDEKGNWLVSTKTKDGDEKLIETFQKKSDAFHKSVEVMRDVL